MDRIGLKPYLNPAVQSYIITSFPYPSHPAYNWPDFYRRVAEKGFLLYPGKISKADTFRIGNIGRLFPADMRAVVYAIREALVEQ
jgi:2-aminoethylphosphonate-pyruvate transaminase